MMHQTFAMFCLGGILANIAVVSVTWSYNERNGHLRLNAASKVIVALSCLVPWLLLALLTVRVFGHARRTFTEDADNAQP